MENKIDNESVIVGERLHRLLDQRPHGQDSAAWLSRKAGVSEGAISNIISGKRKNVRLDTLIKLAEALETTVDFLVGVTDEPYPARFDEWPEYAHEIMEQLRQLSRARSYEVYMIARSLRESREEVNRIIREEIVELVLSRGEEVDEEQVDALIDLLQAAENRPPSRRLPPDDSDEPDQDGS